MDRDWIRNEADKGREGAHVPPTGGASMEELIRTVNELVSLTANAYPPWLLRLYKNNLYEAARAARRRAVERRMLLRSIERNLRLLSDGTVPDVEDVASRRPTPASRYNRPVSKQRRRGCERRRPGRERSFHYALHDRKGRRENGGGQSGERVRARRRHRRR